MYNNVISFNINGYHITNGVQSKTLYPKMHAAVHSRRVTVMEKLTKYYKYFVHSYKQIQN